VNWLNKKQKNQGEQGMWRIKEQDDKRQEKIEAGKECKRTKQNYIRVGKSKDTDDKKDRRVKERNLIIMQEDQYPRSDSMKIKKDNKR
jgi:hypothetical protein